MTDVCQCAEPGFCERRQCLMSGIHFRRCQAGQVEILDQLYKNKLDPVPPIKQSDMVIRGSGQATSTRERKTGSTATGDREKVGTALKSRIEKLITIKTGKGCGCKNLAAEMDKWGIAGCELRREQIIGHLVGNRSVLVDALNLTGFLGHAMGLAVEFIPDMMLRAGAETLLNHAIDDVRALSNRVRNVSRSKNQKVSVPEVCRTPIDTIKPRPFTAQPRLTLICHCWPNGDGWKRHAEYLAPVAGVFTRKIMGIATGPGTATFAEVQAVFGDSWEYFEAQNDKKLREVLTYQQMLPMISTTDENDVTFCVHLKGVQNHTTNSKQIKWWTEAMYATVIYNWKNVLLKMAEGYPIAGSFIRNGKHLRARYEWHYSGTFYAFRNAATFANGIPQLDAKWYGTESWPGHHFARHEAACMFADNCGDLYKPNTKTEHELNEWKEHNDTL